MGKRDRFLTAMFIPLLLAVLAAPASAATPGKSGSHYPGQECSGCHKIRGKATGKTPARPAPANPTKGTGSPGSQTGVPPEKGATQPR